jgi:hypothetical protein
MKAFVGTLLLGIAVPSAAMASPQQAPEGVVTVRKRGSTWYFRVNPEGHKKMTIDDKEVEIDVPPVIHAVWALDEPYAPLRGPNANTVLVSEMNEARRVTLYRPGKRYPENLNDSSELVARTQEQLSGLQKDMLEGFYQFDLDFPGGSWEELAALLRDQLTLAYEKQLPPILKPFYPAKVEVEISSKSAQHARYPAIQAKSVSLAMLRSFGPAPFIEGKTESTPSVVESEDKSLELVINVGKSSKQLVLADANALVSPDSLEVAFFHLGSKSTLPGADHVVALFEMAWKARGGPLYAKVKFHPETKTLMVQGTYDEIQSADKVFATLTGRSAPIEASANPFDALNAHLQRIAELIKKQIEEKGK